MAEEVGSRDAVVWDCGKVHRDESFSQLIKETAGRRLGTSCPPFFLHFHSDRLMGIG